jgi:DNA-binding MarR family transcriptional regulator
MTLGLVEVADHPSDRRALMIRISEKGKELVQNRIKADRQILVRILSDWNEEDRSQFADLFTRFVKSIDRVIAQEANRATDLSNGGKHKDSLERA